MLKLREYQKTAINTAIKHCKASSDPVVLLVSVGGGKTIIIKEICSHVISNGGQCLSLAHTKELLEDAVKTFGDGCCAYSSSLGRKELDKKMIYGGEQSIVNVLQKLPKIDLLTIDETDRVNDSNPESSYMKIISHVLKVNPKCRILGFTGTVTRMVTGAIYGKKRLFKKLIIDITPAQLLNEGYLTPVITPSDNSKYYDFADKKSYTNKYLEEVVNSDHRLTKHIIDNIIFHTKNRNKVLIFGTTINHCYEIKSHFNNGDAEVLSSKLKKSSREEILYNFHYGNCKYLINRDILTVGYSFKEIDALAILRPTESRRLLEQIIGRMMRLHEGKENALFLDYAGNLDRHGTLDELFDGHKSKSKDKKDKDLSEDIQCPECGAFNSEHAHKCKVCSFWFISKTCEKCESNNSISARQCTQCGHELINPNDSLHCLPSGAKAFRAKIINTSLSSYTKNKKCLRIDVVADDKPNGYPVISQFLAQGSGLLKHWVSQHLTPDYQGHDALMRDIGIETFTDDIDLILKNESLFKKDEIVTYQKVKGKKYFKFIEER